MESGKEKWLLVSVIIFIYLSVCVHLFMCYLSDLKWGGKSCQSTAVTYILKHDLSLRLKPDNAGTKERKEKAVLSIAKVTVQSQFDSLKYTLAEKV